MNTDLVFLRRCHNNLVIIPFWRLNSELTSAKSPISLKNYKSFSSSDSLKVLGSSWTHNKTFLSLLLCLEFLFIRKLFHCVAVANHVYVYPSRSHVDNILCTFVCLTEFLLPQKKFSSSSISCSSAVFIRHLLPTRPTSVAVDIVWS